MNIGCLPLSAVFGIALSSSVGLAQAAQSQMESALEFSGSLDFYYQYSSQGHPNGVTGEARVLEGRVFDRFHNQFTLNMAELSAKKKAGPFAFRLDIAFGEMVDSLAANGGSSPMGQPAGVNAGANEPTRNITQATVSYSPSDRLTFTAGKFYTHVGLEVAKAKDNWQYSRSYGYNFAPYWHQGVSVNYVIQPGAYSATFYLLNAWDGRNATEADQSPTLGANFNVTAIKDLTLNYNYIGGVESATSQGRREAHELNGVYALTPKLSLAADYTLVNEQKFTTGNAFVGQATWWSAAVYAKYAFTPNYTLSPRLENFDDSDAGFGTSGLVGTASPLRQRISALTLTNSFNLGTPGAEARVEFRADKSDESGYFKNEDGSGSDHQESVTAALLYSF